MFTQDVTEPAFVLPTGGSLVGLSAARLTRMAAAGLPLPELDGNVAEKKVYLLVKGHGG